MQKLSEKVYTSVVSAMLLTKTPLMNNENNGTAVKHVILCSIFICLGITDAPVTFIVLNVPRNMKLVLNSFFVLIFPKCA